MFLLFYGSFFLSSLLLPPHPYPLIVEYLSSFTRSQPPLLVQITAHLDVARTCHPPASAACPCAPHLVTASAGVSCDSATHLLPPSDYTQVPVRPCRPLGGYYVTGPSMPLCPYLVILEFSSESWNHLVLGTVFRWLFTRGREARAPTLLGRCAPW